MPTPTGQGGDGSDAEGSPAMATRERRSAPRAPAKRGRQQQGSAQAPPAKRLKQSDAPPVQQPQPGAANPAEMAAGGHRRAAALGVAAAVRAVANEGMPSQRTSPRRPAAAGVAAAARAVAAAAETSSSDDSEAVGVLLQMAGASGPSTAAEAATNDVESPELASLRPEVASLRPDLAAARTRTAVAGVRNRQRIESQHKPSGEPKNFAVGDPVLLALPRAVTRALEFNKLLCRVVKVAPKPLRFTLRCNAGVLVGTYTGDELSDGSAPAARGHLAFADTRVQGVKVVTLAAAAAVAAEELRNGRPAAVRCNCRNGCGPRCPCRKANVLCSRECGGQAHKKSCENYH